MRSHSLTYRCHCTDRCLIVTNLHDIVIGVIIEDVVVN